MVYPKELTLAAVFLLVGCGSLIGFEERHDQATPGHAGGAAGQAGAAGSGAGNAGTAGVSGGAGSAGMSGAGAMAGSAGAAGSSGSSGASGMAGSGGVPEGPSCAGGLSCNGESCCVNIKLPGGEFKMGRSEEPTASSYYPIGSESHELPQHKPKVAPFVLDKYEVTVGRFRKWVVQYDGTPPVPGAGLHPKVPGSGWQPVWNGALPKTREELSMNLLCNELYHTWTEKPTVQENAPISCVTWYEAMAFCIWDGGRLPTEAEWEYTASGAEERLFPWGNDEPTKQLANVTIGLNYGTAKTPVGSTPKGNGKWGHADLAGSVYEWVFDGYGKHWYELHKDCENCANIANAPTRAGRGGDYYTALTTQRVAHRAHAAPMNRSDGLGFRCARLPNKAKAVLWLSPSQPTRRVRPA